MKQQLSFNASPYPPIEDYALISDCESVALVGRNGAIDWCCMPTMDADSCFGRLLDWRLGGHCSIAPADPGKAASSRSYEDGTMVLATRFDHPSGSVLLHDFFAICGEPGQHDETDHLVRIARCESGTMTLRLELVARFDFGAIVPDLRQVGPGLYTACGSNIGLLIHCTRTLQVRKRDAALCADCTLHAGQTLSLSIRYVPPELLQREVEEWQPEILDLLLQQTLAWWAGWERSA
ncbi:MAG TPA: trehalase-like domain-containing protein, partial [Rubrivivax sp.]|nr:trehalase-like domain-containing protein [Rubrivivax sp.]